MKTQWIQSAVPIVTSIMITGCATPRLAVRGGHHYLDSAVSRPASIVVCRGCDDCMIIGVPDGHWMHDRPPDEEYGAGTGLLPSLVLNLRADSPTVHWRRSVPRVERPYMHGSLQASPNLEPAENGIVFRSTLLVNY